MLKKTVELINTIASVKGNNNKISIIKDNIENTLMKDIFAFNFDDEITTKLSDKKLSKEVDLSKSDKDIYDIYDFMSYLKNESSGKDCNIATVKKYSEYCKNTISDEVAEFVLKLAMKNIKLGTIGRKALTDIYGEDYLFKVESMGGLSYEDNKDKKDVLGKDIYWSLKIDGFRLHVFMNEDNTYEFYSRKGLKQYGHSEIENLFTDMNYPKGYVADIEVRLPKFEYETAEECYRRSKKVFSIDGEKTGFEVRVFDLIPRSDFNKGVCKIKYEERRALIEKQNSCDRLKPTEILYIGQEEEKIKELLGKVVSEYKEEGIIGYVSGETWKSGKCRKILKYKPFKDVDLRIIGFEQGDSKGKFKDSLGSLFVEWKGNAVGVSGYKDSMRDEIWNNKEKYLGRIIQVRYLDESLDEKTQKPSLRHATFMGFRDDKNTVSYE